MKKIYIILFFLAGMTASFGQGYDIDFTDFQQSISCGQTTTNYGDDFNLTIITVGNSPRGYNVEEIGQATEDGQPCSSYDTFDVNLTASQSLCGSFFQSLGGCCTDWDVDFRIIPDSNFQILTPNPGAANAVGSITLEATSGYDPLVYRWQYFSPTTSQWTLLPAAFQGQSSITFDAQDLFGANASNFYGVSIQYRLELCNGWTPSVFPYTYVFTQQSPGLQSIVPQDTSCSYSSDGGFTVNFDRALVTNEELTMNLRRNSPTGPLEDSLNNVTYTGTSYIWPGNLATGTYYLIYQSEPAGSLIQSGPIVIGSPGAVTFSATWTDVDCFGDNTGSIAISASGGVGSFEYRLDTGAWIPFDNSNSHTISNLSAGNYDVRVRDANSCTEQN